MAQDYYNMPGIVEVRYLRPEEIPPGVMNEFLAGVPVAVFAHGTNMPLHGIPTCVSTEEHSNNGRVEKVTLTFNTTGAVPRGGVGWMVKQADGCWWLIGSKERVHPTVKIQTNTGVPGGDPAMKTVTVEYQSWKALIPLDA